MTQTAPDSAHSGAPMASPGPVVPVVSPRAANTDPRRDILGLSRDELRAALIEIGVPERQANMRAKQIWNWVYHRGVTDFEAMTNVAKEVRARLGEAFCISRPEIVDAQYSNDGTRKYLLRFDDGSEAEAVYIPDEDRGTLCISSQVGCTLNCRFCHTGTMRLVRNLTPGEIVAQMMVARDDLGEWPASTDNRRVTNIVMMGMGEPLYNFDNVKKALQIVMDKEGIQMSRRRITLSTAGVVPMMLRCGEEIGVNLAVSLHAVNNETRDEIVPLNKKYRLEQLMEACAAYPGTHNARRITFEYIMLKDINDSDADARELVRLLTRYKLPAKVNLIPFNPWPGSPYECSDWDRVERFSDLVFKAGISAPIRTPRGRDIMAACGQLKSASEKKRKSEILREQAAATQD
ncbi:dual-specificity RNA methyltransferase RlmN [Iodidimonas gelatinilytica]|uniref:Dual-specificity RNA methyltransferase RlmN n=1 Tax=Iodidimonas gelatinilytica TaxID=1236966 RepID=A0A5A7MNR1_9PROT|nr:23S rRNA (adenine(2503)-C(2))-methyltransferase RlmN [Iodidimonas gelatinilytica]GEQ97652.1 dual-specificity RNA methyltransferase RlmN [Iodidimonas gelatinilytica]GER01882.1 dual-specificity RNA methyltransferase RlmN [Iodidimonas gelatinilytica]